MVDWDSPGGMWHPVPGHPCHAVSEPGQVLSLSSGLVLRPWLNNTGYPTVRLSPDRRNRLVHRLVALTFYGPCPEGMEVRHLDGNRANPAAGNLAYGTRGENIEDMRAHGTHPSQRPKAAICQRGHQMAEGKCPECYFVAKKAWVRKNVGKYVKCDNCGRELSALNITRHKRTARCKGEVTGRWA